MSTKLETSFNKLDIKDVPPTGLSKQLQTKWKALNFSFDEIRNILEYPTVLNYFEIFINSIRDDDADGIGMIPNFLEWVLNDDDLKIQLEDVRREQGPTMVLNRLLKLYFTYLADSITDNLTPEQKLFVEQLNGARGLFEFSHPQNWFPRARSMKRKLIVHVGPTNSGKTYRALERLKASQYGVYCGPLRLMAIEVWKKFNSQGIRCNLITGEEQKIYDDGLPVPITSSTVEMANLRRPIEVAVIDEIQMIGDKQRGFAWTRALLGIPASEIHLCGEESAIPLIKWIAETLGEEVHINNYERLSGLTVSPNPTPGIHGIQPGDCIISFTRTNIFSLKKEIESKTSLKCAVVYGKLPPENRLIQAELFNDKNSGYDVMIASDAVGMGLNLNIKRIVFSTMKKHNGTALRGVPTRLVKQIGGRAGRFGTQYSSGIVTTLDTPSFEILEKKMKKSTDELTTVGIQPDPSLVDRAICLFPKLTPEQALVMLSALAVTDSKYICEFTDDQLLMAKLLQSLNFPTDIMLIILYAPIRVKYEQNRKFVYGFLKDHATKKMCLLSDHIKKPKSVKITSLADLEELEECHLLVCLYIWLSFRFPKIYVELDFAHYLKEDVEIKLQNELLNSSQLEGIKSRNKRY